MIYYKLNQGKLWVELYQELSDIDLDYVRSGQMFVLLCLFISSPRHMFEIFQDSMAITRYIQHPDIFLTMIANPNWPKITSALLPHQKPIDRPDLIARAF